VLGSGGAARAIAMTVALRGEPSDLSVLGVVDGELAGLERDIAERAGRPASTAHLDDASLAKAIAGTDVLLQCTPIGMTPNTDKSLVPASLLRPDLAVFDAVYNPRRTKLLKDAAAVGCRVVEGMEMFLGQAMVQFELWTGQPAPADTMRAVIEARL